MGNVGVDEMGATSTNTASLPGQSSSSSPNYLSAMSRRSRSKFLYRLSVVTDTNAWPNIKNISTEWVGERCDR